MKIYILWGKRITECSLCNDAILPKTARITVVEKIYQQGKINPSEKNGVYRRTHYHYKPCFISYIDSKYDNMPYYYSSKGGRPKLDMTDDERKLRFSLLRRLHYIKTKYGSTIDKVIDTRDITQLDPTDIIRYGRSIKLRDDTFNKLEELGGVPDHYR